MCYVCGINKSKLVESFWGANVASHYQPPGTAVPVTSALTDAALAFGSTAKYYDAFPVDGVGDAKPVTLNTVLLLTPDAVADDTSTTATVTVGGGSVVSTIDTIGDQDFFAVELVAGRTYDIGQYAEDRRSQRRAAVRRLHRIVRCRRQSRDQRRRGRAQHAERARRTADLRRAVQRHLLHQRPRLRPGRDQRHRRRRGRRL